MSLPQGQCEASPNTMYASAICESPRCGVLPNFDVVSTFCSMTESTYSITYSQKEACSVEGGNLLFKLPEMQSGLSVCKAGRNLLPVNKMNEMINELTAVRSQKSLLDLVTESRTDASTRLIDKEEISTLTLTSIKRIVEISKLGRPGPDSDLLQPVSTSIAPLNEAQMIHRSQEVSLSNLSRETDRSMNKKPKTKTLSDHGDHQRPASRLRCLSHVTSVQQFDSHNFIPVEGLLSCYGVPGCPVNCKPEIVFHCECESEPMLKNRKYRFLTLEMSHGIKRSSLHSFLEHRQYILGKLREEYVKKIGLNFDFSFPSPDDAVQAKQCAVFLVPHCY